MANFRAPPPAGARGGATLPVNGAGAAPPPPRSGHRSTGTGDSNAEMRRELVLDLTQTVLDVAGIFEPTPFADLTSASISLARSRWLDAALSGVSVIPYVGDLAKIGKLPRYVRTLERLLALAERDAQFAAEIEPIVQRLKQALDLLPESSNANVNRLKHLADKFLAERRAKPLPDLRPDISDGFKFTDPHVAEASGNLHKVAEGRLGVPGKVKVHRSKSAQSGVSTGMGDDAGHLIGNRFGAPGTEKNLTLQNRNVNRYSQQSVEHVGRGGSYLELENRWETKLKKGWGIEVKVTDVIRQGDNVQRPIGRIVKWTEISPEGLRTEHEQRFLNSHSVTSREMQEIAPTVDGSQSAKLYDLKDYRQPR